MSLRLARWPCSNAMASVKSARSDTEGVYSFARVSAAVSLRVAIARNHGADAIYSLDKLMIAAGKKLGLPVSAGLLLPGYDD